MYLDFAHTSHKILLSVWLYLNLTNSTNRMANSVDYDQTAPVGSVGAV